MEKMHCYFIFAYVVLLVTCQMSCLAKRSTNLATDQSSLLVLKARITSDPYHILATNWTNSSSVCSWIGVSCGLRHHRVTALNISNMGLSGTIPPQLGNLSFLVLLDLRYNFFGGTLPHELSLLHRLKFIFLEVNNFRGEVPSWIGLLPKLEHLSLRNNSFTGFIPTSLSNLSNLQSLDFSFNSLRGVLPREIGQLDQLEILTLDSNTITGSIPPELVNISTLRILSLYANGLSGDLPTHLCYAGSSLLQRLVLAENYLSGAIPNSISNCSNLRILELGFNNFTGSPPHFLGNLRLLEYLSLHRNNLRSESSSSEFSSFVTSLTNCRSLKDLGISDNPLLDGTLPASIGNLSSSLQNFYAYRCKIKGSIPANIGNLTNLVVISLFDNELSGNIPVTIKHLHKLQGLAISSNFMGGPITMGLCDLHSMSEMYLGQNQFSGSIPECLGNVTSLRLLGLDSNMLTSSIPSSLWRLRDIMVLDLSSNSLSGFLHPNMGNLRAATYINLSVNQLSEFIPRTIENLQNLIDLSLAYNKLEGPIPMSMGRMISLETLDLSYNNLSGSIPKSLEALQHLGYFNVSFNALSGEIPSGGPFRNFTIKSFVGNEALCGIQRFNVPPCHTVSNHKSTRKKVEFALFILGGVVAFITVVSLAFIFLRYRRKGKAPSSRTIEQVSTVPERISYYEILQATEQLNESNLIGIGSFGSVYRGILRDGKDIAVKVFNLQSEASFRSFDVECEVLRNIRHRNLTKVISSCSNEEFKALVFEYVPKGSLKKWLYSHNYCLDIKQRLNIMIDVACALEYLHHGYTTPIVHCDLKPSNVLLDEEMIAHVSDFGIAKLLGEGGSIVLTNTLGTLGYIAPEYGLEGQVSTRGDVYSFGVMLMETFTRKRPSDDMFVGDLSLKNWVESLLPQSSHQVIDANLLNAEDEHFDKVIQCASSILVLALKCSAECPRDRIDMKEALAELKKIKRRFYR